MNLDQLLKAVEILWKGMLTIFVGITTIYLIILVLSHFDQIKNLFRRKQ
ncbi:MAG TPA: hypothetical protein GXZ48_01470 [Acholeplasmataceae bacterium]|jgi:hypothetical protein|nr:hypothetical protein [Acholeplasmataceae bacterium]